MFQGSLNSVSSKFQECFKEGNFNEVSNVFQGCFKEVSRVFQESFQGASRTFKGVSRQPTTIEIGCVILIII